MAVRSGEMLATMAAATVVGVGGVVVRVEVQVANGLPGFSVVGLPDASCREARDRVRAAILSSRLKWPPSRVTVNLAPSGIRKAGAGLDLAVAVGILGASDQLGDADTRRFGFLGELGLDGAVRGVRGVLPMVASLDVDEVVVAPSMVSEASLVPGVKVRAAPSLRALVDALTGEAPWPDVDPAPPAPPARPAVDLAEVRGQPVARLALEVAAAGRHHLLLVGPPGAGKTMLAERLPTVLGDLDDRTALEVSAIGSVSGGLAAGEGLRRRPPFRAPHHSASMVAMIGGGSAQLRPGELTLAHGGVLFLDELGEFPRHVLDALRQPLEEGVIRVTRAGASAVFPASILLLAATNPCPCGFAGTLRCQCSAAAIDRYRRRLSGPLLDRFDLRLVLGATEHSALVSTTPGESSAAVAARVARVAERAAERGAANARLPPDVIDAVSTLTPAAADLLHTAVRAGRLSGRGLRRVRAVALTLDDLAGGDGHIGEAAVATALALRNDVGPANEAAR